MQAVKLGQEFVRSVLDTYQGNMDVAELKELVSRYEGELQQAEQLAGKYYDRLLSSRSYVLINLESAMLAYKYHALQDSAVDLDLLKTTPEYYADITTIKTELNNADMRYGSDPNRKSLDSIQCN